jgi:hypothetical protein
MSQEAFKKPELLNTRSTEDGLTMQERFEGYDRAAGHKPGTFLKKTQTEPPKGINPYDEW